MSSPASHRLLVVDGHAYAYRAFHAIRTFTGRAAATNAIYGFIKMLNKLRSWVRATHLLVIWDGGLAAERLALLPAYKAQRPPMPEDLRPQLDGIIQYLEAAGIASICQAGVEADDGIATASRCAAQAGLEVVIASSDKDFMQLVSTSIGLANPNDKTETVWTHEQVRARTGVDPAQIVDWLSLIGDSVDNIPGVAGVGPKTATELLQQFGSVEALYGRLAEVRSERLRANLGAAEAVVRRNQRMIRLRDDLPGDFAPAAWVPELQDAERLRGLFERWDFKSLLAELPAGESSQKELF